MPKNKAKKLRNEVSNFRKFNYKEWYKAGLFLHNYTKVIINNLCGNIK